MCYFFSEQITAKALNAFPVLKECFDRGMYETNVQSVLLVPVPLTKEKLSNRGYNQAQDLAFALQKALENAGLRIGVGKYACLCSLVNRGLV